MKKICIALTIMFCALVQNISAQEAPFEGEIVYETYENYSDYLLKMANSIWFNGVHKMRMIMKDTKMHVIDETTGVHLIGDIANKSLVHFFEATKTGIDFSNNIESQLVLINRDINYSHTVGKLKEYTYADQNKKSGISHAKREHKRPSAYAAGRCSAWHPTETSQSRQKLLRP